MAITTRDGLISAVAASQSVQFQKASFTGSSGFYYAHFRNAGMPASAGTAPTSTGAALDRTSLGAIPILGPSATSYFSSFRGLAGQPQGLIIADRLVEFGGLSAASVTEQTVSALALPARATGATDVELWIEVYTAGGSTNPVSATASYTNQSGTAGRTATQTFASSAFVINRGYQMALQGSDTGVQSVQSLTLNTSSGTAGNIGLVLRRSLLSGAVLASAGGFTQGWAETDLQVCPDNACLELLSLAGASTTGVIMGNLGISQG